MILNSFNEVLNIPLWKAQNAVGIFSDLEIIHRYYDSYKHEY